jgi:NAD(P)-dependent dehydrogenase (short-subunit alcohol dehydrogenase family)
MTNLTEPKQPLQDQRILLLGGTSGMGLATAQLAASEGASIVVVSMRQTSVDRALTLLPAGTEGYALDLTSEEAVQDFFEHIGAFDHLVFTAGDSLLIGELSTLSLEQGRQFFNLRYWGAFLAAKYGSGHIKAGGSIVLTSGVAGQRPTNGSTLAASISSAVEALTRALAIELAPIRVNVICPSIVKTELWNSMPEEVREGIFQSAGQRLLVGRVGEAADLAQSYLYAIRQHYSTGQVIVVDGGATLV